jgi:hypothetical protein
MYANKAIVQLHGIEPNLLSAVHQLPEDSTIELLTRQEKHGQAKYERVPHRRSPCELDPSPSYEFLGLISFCLSSDATQLTLYWFSILATG